MPNNTETTINILLDAAKRHGADAADAVVAGGIAEEVSVRLGKLESIERSEEYDIGLRVFVGARNALVSTATGDEDAIDKLAERAVAMARIAPENPYAGLAAPEQLIRDIPDCDLMDSVVPSAGQLRELAHEAENAALAVTGISNSEGGHAAYGKTEMMLATSNGFCAGYQRSGFSVSAAVVAEQNGAMETDYDYSSAVYLEDLHPAAEIGANAAARTLARLGAKKPETGRFPVIYDRRVSGSISGHIAAAINGAAIARGTSFLKDAMGEAIASPHVTLTDDPLRPRGLASSPFDGEGLARSKRAFVKNGRLEGWLLDLAAARQLELEPSGNAGRSIGSPPAPTTTNWIMSKGEATLDELIAGIEEGFLITELIGSSVNLITGDYSRGASGFWIRAGKVDHPVTEATIAGNLKDMLKTITPADDLDFSKAKVTPSLRIDGMTIAGA